MSEPTTPVFPSNHPAIVHSEAFVSVLARVAGFSGDLWRMVPIGSVLLPQDNIPGDGSP